MNPESSEKKHRDHRELGQLLDLFSFHEIAPGAVFWHGNGMVVMRALEDYLRRQLAEAGYEEISTPIMTKTELFKKSGHWDFYRENMFYFKNPADEKEELTLKPMNCPESTFVYNARTRSYRDLPLRLAEFGRLHRNERSGTLGGLFRVRQITMDDAHIYCRPDQVQQEVLLILRMIENLYAAVGFGAPHYFIATRPDKALGEQAMWNQAERDLVGALKESKVKFNIKEKDGAFYGPKIDCHINDSQGRDWQLATIQLDMAMLPQKFDVHYIDEGSEKQRPYVIHRALLGSFERFIGVLLEHCDGALPIWLAPVQAVVMTVSDGQMQYAEEIYKKLIVEGVRAQLDTQNATINKKIREAEIKRIPRIVVVGEKEVKDKTVSVRKETKKLTEFLKEIIEHIKIPEI